MSGNAQVRKFKTVAMGSIAAAALLGASVVHGATTTMSEAALALDGSNIVNLGGPIRDAINFDAAADGPRSPTINGVPFVGTVFTGNGSGYTLNGTDWSLHAPNSSGLDRNRSGTLSNTAAVYPLVNSSAFGQGLVLTLNSLTVGQTYEVQMMFCFDGGRTVSVADASPAVGSGGNTINVNYGGGAGSPAEFTGTFTADATGTQAYNLGFGSTPANDAYLDLSGFSVQAVSVPEPASLGLLGLASLGLVARRRKA